MMLSVARSWAAIAAVALVGSASIAWSRTTSDERRFPHRVHEKLFPTCTGCHAGIAEGNPATAFPAPEACAGCHNGTDAKRVTWDKPIHTPSNLAFEHLRHSRSTQRAGDSLDCLTCHGVGSDAGARPWMVVQRAPPAQCTTCHAHRAVTHLAAEAKCETCHVPLTRAVALTDSAVAAISKPPSHESATWIAAHRQTPSTELTRCAVCHSQESCARCHVNAGTLVAVTALGSDARVARMVRGRAPSYPIPASHGSRAFATAHGSVAKTSIATCANCHAQQSCFTCHLGPLGAQVIAKLPRTTPGGATGVQLRGATPMLAPPVLEPQAGHLSKGAVSPAVIAVAQQSVPSGASAARTTVDTTKPTLVTVHTPDFARAHGSAAASGALNCAGCHQQRFCTSCHQGSGERRYHQFNFVARHASNAYARETSCTSCHNTETFCRACHVQNGLAGATTNRRVGAAHGAQALWLLQHGQAARQGLQSCAGCHQQTDCLRCHSTVTQRVNPHGPNFDARQMQSRSKIVCGYCHIGDPLK